MSAPTTTAPHDAPDPVAGASSAAPDTGALRRWLAACIVAVFLAVVVGGITRLTESGLSITEWKPVTGVFPPTTDAGWQEAYEAFLRIPQAQTTHQGITLGGFKWIYWWEWFHRILARGVGLVFAIPYVWLLWRGGIPQRLRLRLAALPALTLGQGVLGWYMVQSGLAERSSVSAYRLTAHLALALAILVVALWTWADLRPPEREGRAGPASAGWRWGMLALVAAIGATILSGGFVAGLRAGTIFNTFPLMGGAVVPPGYGQLAGWWTNAFENPIAAQFHHRVLAILTGAAALFAAWRAGRAGHERRSGRAGLGADAVRAVRLLGGMALLQVLLGIATLLLAVPLVLGVLHQFVGVLVLGAGVLAVHAVRGGTHDGVRG
jgi:heme a synthase